VPLRRSWVLLVLAALLAAGCIAPGGRKVEISIAGNGTGFGDGPFGREVGGANVSWMGEGDVSFVVDVPNGTDRVEFLWRADRNTTGDLREMHVSGGPCPDTHRAGGRGKAAGGLWCSDPTPGPSVVKVKLYDGRLSGRVCVIAFSGDARYGECWGRSPPLGS